MVLPLLLSQQRSMRFEDLKLAVDWRKSGGIWPEE